MTVYDPYVITDPMVYIAYFYEVSIYYGISFINSLPF